MPKSSPSRWSPIASERRSTRSLQLRSLDVEAVMPSALRSCQCRAVNQMPDERLLSVGVECYAGHRGEQTPRELILGDHRVSVAEVLDAWRAPGYRSFKPEGAAGDRYRVRHA